MSSCPVTVGGESMSPTTIGAELPPPGLGLKTVTGIIAIEPLRVLGTNAKSLVEPRYSVTRFEEPSRAREFGRKVDPLMTRVEEASVANEEGESILVTTGRGLFTGIGS